MECNTTIGEGGHLSPKLRAMRNVLFSQCDENHDGRIDQGELRVLVHSIGGNDADFDNLVNSVKPNANGVIDRSAWAEDQAALESPCEGSFVHSLLFEESDAVPSLRFRKVVALRDALHANPQCAESWCGLGKLLEMAETVEIDGREFSKKGCFAEALRWDPENSRAWQLLATAMGSDEVLVIQGTEIDRATALSMFDTFSVDTL